MLAAVSGGQRQCGYINDFSVHSRASGHLLCEQLGTVQAQATLATGPQDNRNEQRAILIYSLIPIRFIRHFALH